MIFLAKQERREKSPEAALNRPLRTFFESDAVTAEKALFYPKWGFSGDC